jgi:hypothetical protein
VIDRVRALLLVVCAGVAAASGAVADPPAPASPPQAPAPAAGPVYKNPAVGLTITGPQGWTLKTENAAASAWKKLAVYALPGTQVEVTVSQRDRTAATLEALHAAVQKEWQAEKAYNVAGVRMVDPTALRPVGMVQVEATQIKKPEPTAGAAPAGPAATPVLWHYLVSYVMVQRHEVLVHATGPAVAWPRARGAVQTLLDSIVLSAPPKGVEGEGGYRNDERGFTVRYPKGYTVVIPQRRDHVVSFVPTNADQPVLDVYLIEWKQAAADDAERLVKHFKETRGGEASAKPGDVAGMPGVLVTAEVVESGRESTVVLALFKRGDELFRLRGSFPRTADAAGKAAFDEFLKSFALTGTR